jgi:sulfate permease, SulP family
MRAEVAHYFRGAARDDAVAAMVCTVLLVPQCLAYALLAGLPPQVGLYASLLPLVAYALIGSSPVMGVGPVALLALMISQAVGAAPAGFAPSQAALVLAIETGVFLALAALLRLDALASLLSAPVMRGVETGAALAIAASQLPVVLGSSAGGSTAVEVARSWWAATTPWTAGSAAFGLGSAMLLWLARGRVRHLAARWLPAAAAMLVERLVPLLLMVAAMALALALQVHHHGVALVGALPALTLPIGLPPLNGALWWALLAPSALIALVAYVSSLAVAESLALRRGERLAPRRELAGLAAANLAAGVSGGMPVAGSFSRSVVNYDAGMKTRAGGLWVAGFMALAFALLAEPLAWLPKPVLAATIMVAVLAVLDWTPFAQARRYSRAEWAQMCIVTLLTAAWSTEAALGVGVVLSVALLLQRTARPHVARIGRVPGTEHFRNVDRVAVEVTPGVVQLRIDESLVFTNARALFDIVTVATAAQPDARRVVLQMSPVNAVDYSGLDALHSIHDALAVRGVRLDLSEVKGPVMDGLKAGGWERWFRGRVFLSHHQAVIEPPGTP